MLRRRDVLLLLSLAVPLLAGTCAFSSGSGSTNVAVSTGGCAADAMVDGVCPLPPEGGEPAAAVLAAGAPGRSAAASSLPEPNLAEAAAASLAEAALAGSAVSSVPEPTAGLLFLMGAALVARRARAAAPNGAC